MDWRSVLGMYPLKDLMTPNRRARVRILSTMSKPDGSVPLAAGQLPEFETLLDGVDGEPSIFLTQIPEHCNVCRPVVHRCSVVRVDRKVQGLYRSKVVVVIVWRM